MISVVNYLGLSFFTEDCGHRPGYGTEELQGWNVIALGAASCEPKTSHHSTWRGRRTKSGSKQPLTQAIPSLISLTGGTSREQRDKCTPQDHTPRCGRGV